MYTLSMLLSERILTKVNRKLTVQQTPPKYSHLTYTGGGGIFDSGQGGFIKKKRAFFFFFFLYNKVREAAKKKVLFLVD